MHHRLLRHFPACSLGSTRAFLGEGSSQSWYTCYLPQSVAQTQMESPWHGLSDICTRHSGIEALPWEREKEAAIPGMVVHTYNRSSQEAEAGGFQQVQGQPC